MLENEQIFKTISGVQKCFNKIKLPIKIHKIEEEIEAHVIKNDNFSYDVLLGLDAIQKFRLIQDENLNILQRVSDTTTEHLKESNFVKTSDNREEYLDFLDKLHHLEQEQKEKLTHVINKHVSIFAKHTYDIGEAKKPCSSY